MTAFLTGTLSEEKQQPEKRKREDDEESPESPEPKRPAVEAEPSEEMTDAVQPPPMPTTAGVAERRHDWKMFPSNATGIFFSIADGVNFIGLTGRTTRTSGSQGLREEAG